MNSLLIYAIRIIVALVAFQILTTGLQAYGYSYGVSAMGAVGIVLTGFFISYYRIDQVRRKTD